MTRRRAACSRKRAEDSTRWRTTRTRQSRPCVSHTSSSTCAISKPPIRGGLRARAGQGDRRPLQDASALSWCSASPPSGSAAVARPEKRLRSRSISSSPRTRDTMHCRKRSQESRSQPTRRTRDRPRGSEAPSTSWTNPSPRPAIPPARAIPRAAAHRRTRRGRIRERAGTRRRARHRRRDRPGANARQPGEPTSERRVLKDR